MSKADLLNQKVLGKLSVLTITQETTLDLVHRLFKKIERLEAQIATNEPIDPNKDYKTRDLQRILKQGKNQILALLKSGEIPAEKQAGAGGYKVKGTALIAYIEQKREKAALPHAARG